MSQANGAAQEVIKLADNSVEIDADSTEGAKLSECTGHLVFQDVHFRWVIRPPAIKRR